MPRADVVVIGAGLAGLSCAAELSERGARVFLAAKGMATTHWTHGGLDVAAPPGARTSRDGARVLSRIDGHPYALLDDALVPAIGGHLARLGRAGLAFSGSLDAPLVPIPTAIGALRPAAILPDAQASALEAWNGDGLLLVGYRRYRDAWASYSARNLARADWPGGPRRIQAVEIDLPGADELNNLNARTVGLLFDRPAWRERALRSVADAVPPDAWRIGLPATLGVADHAAALEDARRILGRHVFEIPSLPPSVPGMRLYEALRSTILGAGGRMQVGFEVVRVEVEGRRIAAIHTGAATRTLRLVADEFVLATGGIGGEGIRAEPDGTLVERVFGIHVEAPPRESWFSDDPLVGHPIEALGLRTDAELRPLTADGEPAFDNLRAIGSVLAGMHYLAERCGDGVALASAHRAAGALDSGRLAA
jgi:glycerol-3-phosphate dehydrogenase subunit B